MKNIFTIIYKVIDDWELRSLLFVFSIYIGCGLLTFVVFKYVLHFRSNYDEIIIPLVSLILLVYVNKFLNLDD